MRPIYLSQEAIDFSDASVLSDHPDCVVPTVTEHFNLRLPFWTFVDILHTHKKRNTVTGELLINKELIFRHMLSYIRYYVGDKIVPFRGGKLIVLHNV